MITFLKGTLTDALPTQAVIDVNGIGYEVLIRCRRSRSCRSLAKR